MKNTYNTRYIKQPLKAKSKNVMKIALATVFEAVICYEANM